MHALILNRNYDYAGIQSEVKKIYGCLVLPFFPKKAQSKKNKAAIETTFY
jgi:hypothetical protein